MKCGAGSAGSPHGPHPRGPAQGVRRPDRQKRYEESRIADILGRANVGKSTFYEHFRSKEDLLRSTMDGILRDLADCASEDFDPGRLNGLVGHFWDNRRLGRVVFGVPMVASTRRMLAALIEERLAARESRRRPDRNALRLNALQIAAGHLALLHAWLSGEVVAEREAIVAALRELACPGREEKPVPKEAQGAGGVRRPPAAAPRASAS